MQRMKMIIKIIEYCFNYTNVKGLQNTIMKIGKYVNHECIRIVINHNRFNRIIIIVTLCFLTGYLYLSHKNNMYEHEPLYTYSVLLGGPATETAKKQSVN